mmetsp:Transcript_58538/g.166200  ORF Transcript_58538/g.166200 Transcript_58538/m.166200 type:complete len:309 (-) Transcript_58538:395-1321(-)
MREQVKLEAQRHQRPICRGQLLEDRHAAAHVGDVVDAENVDRCEVNGLLLFLLDLHFLLLFLLLLLLLLVDLHWLGLLLALLRLPSLLLLLGCLLGCRLVGFGLLSGGLLQRILAHLFGLLAGLVGQLPGLLGQLLGLLLGDPVLVLTELAMPRLDGGEPLLPLLLEPHRRRQVFDPGVQLLVEDPSLQVLLALRLFAPLKLHLVEALSLLGHRELREGGAHDEGRQVLDVSSAEDDLLVLSSQLDLGLGLLRLDRLLSRLLLLLRVCSRQRSLLATDLLQHCYSNCQLPSRAEQLRHKGAAARCQEP